MPMPVCSGAMAIQRLLPGYWSSNHNMLWYPVPGAPRCGVHSITVITPVSSDRPDECAGQRAFAKVCADATAGPLGIDRPLTLWIAGLVPSPLSRTGEQARLPLEVADVAEPLVDAGEPHVRDPVELTEPLEDGDADLLAGRLPAPRPDGLFQLGAQLLHLLDSHRPVLGRGLHPGDELGPQERLAVSRPLHHHQRRL